MTEAEVRAYAENPDTFFGVVRPTGEVRGPLELYNFTFASYGKASKDDLLCFMAGRSDIECLRLLSQGELAEIYCESLVCAALERTVTKTGTSDA